MQWNALLVANHHYSHHSGIRDLLFVKTSPDSCDIGRDFGNSGGLLCAAIRDTFSTSASGDSTHPQLSWRQ